MSVSGSLDPTNALDVDGLRVCVAVARARSFAAGGARLGVPPSTGSRAIARLEAAVGARLLHRSSRSVTLTEDGARLLETTGPAMDDLGDQWRLFVESSRGEPAGKLRVSAPLQTGSEIIAPALFAFLAEHPRVTLELRLTNALVDVARDGFDLAFRAGPIADDTLVARRLWATTLVLAASRDFVRTALGGKRHLSRAILERTPAILTGRREWCFSGGSVRPTARVFADDPRGAIAAATSGLGLVLTRPEAAMAAGLRVLTTDLGKPEGRDVFAVYPAGVFVPSRVRHAIEWVKRRGETTPETQT